MGAFAHWMQSCFRYLSRYRSLVRNSVSIPLLFLQKHALNYRFLAEQLVLNLLQLESHGFNLLSLVFVLRFQLLDSLFLLFGFRFKQGDSFSGFGVQNLEIAK